MYDDFPEVFLLSVVKCWVAPVAGQLFTHNGPDEGSLQDENVVSIPELAGLAGMNMTLLEEWPRKIENGWKHDETCTWWYGSASECMLNSDFKEGTSLL